MMKKIGMLLICLSLAVPFTMAADPVQPVRLQANETESLLALFNRTTVSGGDVELIAGLGEKLDAARTTARALEAPETTVPLSLSPEEIRYCLAVIHTSTFEARYAGLVLGIKEKLANALEADAATTAEQRRDE